jgi:hypothetical protein
MRVFWLKPLCFGACLLVAVLGCRSSQPDLKPPPMPEEFQLPPNETRYSDFVNYPKDTLYQSPFKKTTSAQTGPTGPGSPRYGAGPGMP